MVINAECGKTFRIAYQGENKRQQVRFDLADIMGEFPGGTAVLAVLRNGDADPVPAAETAMDGTSLIWTVTAWECAVEGFVYAQVTYAVDQVVAKTRIWRFDVKNSLVVSGAEPEEWADLVGQLVTAAAGVNTAIEAAQEQLRQYVAAAEAAQRAAEEAVGQYDDMTATATGLAAGSAPTAEIDHSGSAPVLRLGIPAGERGADGAQGPQGERGPAGPAGPKGDPGEAADVIDDTAASTSKTFSSSKLEQQRSDLLNEITNKADEPTGTKSAGKVYGLDSNLNPAWVDGGGGAVDDVQINGTSIVNQGVASVPLAGNGVLGVSKVDGIGLYTTQTGTLLLKVGTAAQHKGGINNEVPVIVQQQHNATFYGLAKAAGSDEKNSSLPVGQYTESAKSAISQMLDAPVSVSGTTPSITAMPGVRYICGQVDTLTIVVPASGCIDVTFESGSTPTVLTVTPPSGMTMRWANGFDPTALEANTTYEINIMDGCLGVAGSWT